MVFRSRSWPAASPSAPVSPPWSLWPVWIHAPPCRAARPAAVRFLPEAPPCTTASGCLPRRPCCSGSGNSVTSKEPLSGHVTQRRSVGCDGGSQPHLIPGEVCDCVRPLPVLPDDHLNSCSVCCVKLTLRSNVKNIRCQWMSKVYFCFMQHPKSALKGDKRWNKASV